MGRRRAAMTRPAVLLFDLGGVLVENVGFDRFNALLPAQMPLEELKTRWLASPAARDFESGACSAPEFARAVVDEWQLPLRPDVFLDSFTSWLLGPYQETSALLSELRGRYTLAC